MKYELILQVPSKGDSDCFEFYSKIVDLPFVPRIGEVLVIQTTTWVHEHCPIEFVEHVISPSGQWVCCKVYATTDCTESGETLTDCGWSEGRGESAWPESLLKKQLS